MRVAAFWRCLKKRTGIGGKRMSAYNARRYMATMQLAMGRSPKDVQRQMGGHTTLTMMNHYASLTVQHLQKSHKKYSPMRAEKGSSEEAFGEGYWSE